MDFLSLVKNSGFWSKTLAVLAFLYENAEEDTGYVFATYKDIQDAAHATPPTVAKVMTELQRDGLIKKLQNGVWQLQEKEA